jgi:hypothetical protein
MLTSPQPDQAIDRPAIATAGKRHDSHDQYHESIVVMGFAEVLW